jgi:hypothetical protein
LLLAGLTTSQQWFFVFMGWLIVPVMIWTTLLYRNWPTGIRLDQTAVSIGAVGSTRAARRTPTVTHQSQGLFTCPWPAVYGIHVVTDRAELRQMKNSPRYYTLTNRWGTKRGMSDCNTGVLASPFMRAALVIEVDPAAVTTSQIRPARYYGGSGLSSLTGRVSGSSPRSARNWAGSVPAWRMRVISSAYSWSSAAWGLLGARIRLCRLPCLAGNGRRSARASAS